MRNYNACPKCTIFAARCYASAAYAIMRCVCVSGCVWLCVSVTFVHSVKTNKHTFKIFFTIHTILVFPYRTAWQITPNEDVQCMWGRQKSRLWANIWLHWVLWSVPAASAIHLAATNHGELITLVTVVFVDGGRRLRSVWQEASKLRRRQRYAVVNLKPKYQ